MAAPSRFCSQGKPAEAAVRCHCCLCGNHCKRSQPCLQYKMQTARSQGLGTPRSCTPGPNDFCVSLRLEATHFTVRCRCHAVLRCHKSPGWYSMQPHPGLLALDGQPIGGSSSLGCRHAGHPLQGCIAGLLQGQSLSSRWPACCAWLLQQHRLVAMSPRRLQGAGHSSQEWQEVSNSDVASHNHHCQAPQQPACFVGRHVMSWVAAWCTTTP